MKADELGAEGLLSPQTKDNTLENLICAAAECTAMLDPSMPEAEVRMYQDWWELVGWRRTFIERADATKEAVAACVRAKLQAEADRLKPMSGGLQDKSWKEGIGSQASMAELRQAGKVITSGAPAVNLAKAFKSLKKEPHYATNLHSNPLQGLLWCFKSFWPQREVER